MTSRPSRQELHMMTAMMWATRSCCKRNQQGCVITNGEMTQVLSIGYNGPAKSLPNDRCNGKEGQCQCLHAEQNALVRANNHHKDRVMFITMTPCVMCAQSIINAEINKVYFLKVYRDQTGLYLLKEAGVEVFPTSTMEDLKKLLSFQSWLETLSSST